MTFQEKRHAKKLAKIFLTLGYVVMVVWGLTMVAGLINLIILNPEPEISGLTLVLVAFVPIIISLVLALMGQRYSNKRLAYQKYIENYRQYNYFVKTIKLVQSGEYKRFKNANRIYNMVTEDALRRFLFSFILTSSCYSDDPKDVVKGEEGITKILSDFNPEKLEIEKISFF